MAGAECPALAHRVQYLGRRRHGIRVFLYLDGRHDGEDVSLFLVDVDIDFVFVFHPFETLFEQLGCYAKRATVDLGALSYGMQFVRHEASLVHAVACHADERCDVYADGADQ
jgi:hypothetical protein